MSLLGGVFPKFKSYLGELRIIPSLETAKEQLAVIVGSSLLLAFLLSLSRIGVVSGENSFLTSPITLSVGLSIFWITVSVAGFTEWRHHRKNLASIPIRIHVNGSRGKTGTCRLIGAALRANGIRVVTKTTGKMPAVIDVWGHEQMLRKHEGGSFPEGNIKEQKKIVALAAKQHAQALVVECMALAPESQQVSEEKLIKATIGVITNIRHDHLDVIGPDIESAAHHLCRMIPRKQLLVTCEDHLIQEIRQEATRRGATVAVADPDSVPDGIIERFPYITFKENVAIALKVSELLGLDREKALEGMLESKPDFGTVRVYNRNGRRGRYDVVSAFGVNDVDSLTTVIGELEVRHKIGAGPKVGLFNSRDDRAQRSVEFGQFMGEKIPFEKIVVTGEYVGAFERSALKAGYPQNHLKTMQNVSPKDVISVLDEITPSEGVVVATGNMVTSFGYGFIGILEEERAWSSQS